MSDGGGTVAGESPDKAEQRESAVGGDGKDPRLSVLQGRVDEPTAVFRTLAPRTAPEDQPEADASEAEPSDDAEPSGVEDAAVDETVADEDAAEAQDAEADAEGGEPREEAPEGEAEPETDDRPEADGKAGAKAEGESWFAARKPAAPKAEEKPEPEPEPEVRPEARPEAKAEKPVDQPTAVFKAFTPPAAKEEPKADEPAAAAKPVDQPTAVFKAFTPPAAKEEPKADKPAAKPAPQPVDQPTTALKLPPSTFRPLKGDITQEQPKPEPKAQPAAPAPKPAAAATPVPPSPSSSAPSASLSEPERTRQQPLPPRPPLEILAELTNTPPPPETPLRTTFRRLKIWTPLVILLLVVFAVVQIVRPLPDPKLVLSAAPTFTFEGGALQMPWPGEGQGAAEVEGVGSLGTYGPQKPAPIASVAKTMTAYVILRDHPIKGKASGPEIEVDKTAGEQAKAKDESTAPIKKGQTYSQKELLQLLMIPSGNNVARLLARWDAGSEAAFVDKMNAAAKELGMTGSTYTDPSGLQATTVSTPLDQLKLAKAVMQYDVFRAIVDMPNVTIDGIPTRIENNNTILLEPGVTGIKTGSSTPAGGNLLWAANTVVDGQKRRILGIVMGAKDAPQLWQKLDLAIANSLKLIQKAQADVTSAAVVKKGQVVGYVDDGLGGRTPVVSTKDLKAVGWPGLKVDLRLDGDGKKLPHSAKAGDVVGQVSIGTGTGAVSAPVALQKDLVEPGFGEKLTRLG
ncbi:serine hydrolase [Streptomyces sp. NPDC048623]|uniref:D-alanyl-D-alanine carboxypeptidase family protein n=1 Tax=Streptomyces sp. NPDC048623 TaxID=3155761 RepID=UPI003436BC5A